MVFTLKKAPKIGDVRFKRRFCLIPYRYESKLYWLHIIVITEEFVYGVMDNYWKKIEVKELENRRCDD